MLKRLKRRLPVTYYPYKAFMHRYKCIFIHIPKNAGTSILTLFKDEGGRKHAKWYDFYEANDYFFKRYYKFAIVREPFARLYSAYRYCLKGGNQSPVDLALRDQIMAQSTDFNSFIENVLDADFLMLQLLFQPQYLFIFDRELNCQVDTILRFERIAQDWEQLSREMNFPKEIPRQNASTGDSCYAVSEQAQQKVMKLYRFDYQLLGY